MKYIKHYFDPTLINILPVILLLASSVLLIGLKQYEIGWLILLFGFVLTLFSDQLQKKYVSLLYISIACVAVVPINTSTANDNFLRMGAAFTVAVVFPYLVIKYKYKENIVSYPFSMGRRWSNKEVGYIIFAAVASYFLLPFYLRTSGAYINWSVDQTADSIIRLFIGTNVLGIWDELFFVCTILGIFRLNYKFWLANCMQAVVFTSFLYHLGFTGWGPIMIYPFALLQGYVFMRKHSIAYVVAIHLTIDFVLFLALLNAHHPNLVNIFIT